MILKYGMEIIFNAKQFVIVDRTPKGCYIAMDNAGTKYQFNGSMTPEKLDLLATGNERPDILKTYLDKKLAAGQIACQYRAGDKFVGLDGNTYTFVENRQTRVRCYNAAGTLFDAKPEFIVKPAAPGGNA